MTKQLIALLLLGSVLVGCHTVRFDISEQPVQEIVHERKSFFLWGLFPTNREVDVREHCPYGAAEIWEETSFTDGLFTFIFLGIWELRSSWYHCVGEQTPE